MPITAASPDLPSLEAVERAGLKCWPALQTRWDGDWVWRFADGFTKRANCIQSMNPNDAEQFETRLSTMVEWSRAASARPVFRVTPLTPDGVSKYLDDLGWDRFEPSQIHIKPAWREKYQVRHRVDVGPSLTGEWLRIQADLNRYDARAGEILAKILGKLPDTHMGLTAFLEDGRPAASCLVMIADGITIMTNVVTHPDARRQGFARSLMAAGLNYGLVHGARAASIHVLADNGPAIRLYQGFGFAHTGDYVYRRAPL